MEKTKQIGEMITVGPLPSPGTTICGTVVVVVDNVVAVVDFSGLKSLVNSLSSYSSFY